MRFSIIIFLFFLTSCNTQNVTDTEYKLMNMVLDSLVKQSRKDSIGLRLATLNDSWISKELIMNPGFKHYKNGELINECPENNINSEKFSIFDYQVFKTHLTKLNTKKIKNSKISTNFKLKTKYYKDRLAEFIKNDSTINQKDLQEAFWQNERGQKIYQISSPIVSNDKKIAVIFTHTVNMGLISWTLKNEEHNKWTIFCIEQITVE